MTLNLIDQEIIDIFFKFYKKDFKKADEDLQKNLNKKIAENIAKIENDEDSKIMILQTFSDYSFSFFHVVAKFGLSEDLKKIIYLIGLKNLEQVDINKYTALHHASISGNIENVKVLIGYGANIYAKSSDETRNWLPIHYACKFGFKNIVEEFINSGIDKEVKTSFGLTPIHIACEFGYPDLVKYLVQIGCDTNCETSSENHRLTPLHYAIIINSSDTVDVLFKAGADIHKKNIYGDNALILATKRNYSKIVKNLINFGVVEDIDVALEIATVANCLDSLEIIKMYIEIRDKLFDKSNLIILYKEINLFTNQVNSNNLDDLFINIFDIKISPYFLNNITKKIGVFRKSDNNLEKFASDNGLIELAKELSKLNEIITHKKLSSKLKFS